MNQDDLLYQTRQALGQAQAQISPSIQRSLREARLRAVARAEEKFSSASHTSILSSLRASGSKAWGLGMTFASVATVLVALHFSQKATLDHDLSLVAEIDQKMMTDRLPVQAYLDPGFLAFQEETLEEGAGVTVASLYNDAGTTIRRLWSPASLFPGLANAQGPAWNKLTANQREALAPLETFWVDLDEPRRRKWIKIADRFHQLSPEQQVLAQGRMQEWASLPASDRRQARAAFGGVADAIPENVRVMKWNEYQKLSEKERTRLVEVAQQKIAEANLAAHETAGVSRSAAAIPSTERPRSALANQPAKPLIPQ